MMVLVRSSNFMFTAITGDWSIIVAKTDFCPKKAIKTESKANSLSHFLPL